MIWKDAGGTWAEDEWARRVWVRRVLAVRRGLRGGQLCWRVAKGTGRQIQLYAQRQLAAALTHESPSEMEFAQLATIKAVLLGQVRKGALPAITGI